MVKNDKVLESNPLKSLEIEYNMFRNQNDRIDFILHVLFCLLQFQNNKKLASINDSIVKITTKACSLLFAKAFFMLVTLFKKIKDYDSSSYIFNRKVNKLRVVIMSVRSEYDCIGSFINNCRDEKYLQVFKFCEKGAVKDLTEELSKKLNDSVNKLLILEVKNLKNACELLYHESDVIDQYLLIEISSILVKLYKAYDLDGLFVTNCFNWKEFLLNEFDAKYIKSQIRSRINNI